MQHACVYMRLFVCGMESGKPNKEYSHYIDLFFIMKIMVICKFLCFVHIIEYAEWFSLPYFYMLTLTEK